MNFLVIGGLVVFIFWFLKTEREYNYKEKDSLSFYLKWANLIEDGIILNKDGSFQRTYKIEGHDLGSSTVYELVQMRGRINNILRRLDGRWNLHIEAKRRKVKPHIKSKFNEDILQKFENVRVEAFNSGKFYETEYYFTFSYLPPADNVARIKDKLIEKEIQEEENKLNELEQFKKMTEEYFLMLKNCLSDIKKLNDKETLTYLHSCFSMNDEQVIEPMPGGIYLDSYLSDTPVVPGLVPKVGDEYLGAVSVLGFPTHTCPCFFDELNHLGYEYRWTSRFIFLNREEAIKIAEGYKRKWGTNRKGLMQAMEDKITEEDTQTNYEVEDRQEEAENMAYDLQSEAVAGGYYTFTIIMKNKSEKELEEQTAKIVAMIQNLGFTAVKESINTLEAWLGSMPGDTEHNVRKPLVNTMTLADLLPLSTIWAGANWNKRLNAPPLLFCTSEETTPFRLNLHQGDVGHTAVFGQTGGGKSVLLCTLIANWKKYKNSKVIVFDKGGSSRVLTAAVGGKFYDLGKDELSFQPLANVDNPEERAWAYEWLISIYEQENIQLTSEQKNKIDEALKSLAGLPKSNRTMTGYSLQVQETQLRSGIVQFTKEGSLGRYFDGNRDDLTTEFSWQVFEMDKLMESKSACFPIFQYITHILEEKFFDGTPGILVLDEFKFFLERFGAKYETWIRTLRKKNVSVIFATQGLSEIATSPLKDIILASCPTKIYLPYAEAKSEQFKGMYRSFGLNEREIEIISSAEIKKDYFYTSVSGKRLFQLNLSPLELAYVGASSPEDQEKCKELQALTGNNLEEFNRLWQEYKEIL